MSQQPTLSNTIHLRDFIDIITADPSRNTPGCVEIQTDINIFEEDGFYSPNIIVEPIRTRIHAYLTRQQRDAYVPNAFFYAHGRFCTTLSEDNTVGITVQTLSLMRHPGDVSNFEQYRQHLPEKWCPMVSIIGSVHSGDNSSTGPSESRCFAVKTSVYDTSKGAPVQFSAVCFFETNKRWEKVKTPPSGSLISVTAKLVGRTADTNWLALRILDLAYLPRLNSGPTMSAPTGTPTSKRSRWDGRASSTTPSKKPRMSTPVAETTKSLGNITPSEKTQAEFNPPFTENTIEVPSSTPSPPTTADLEHSPIKSTLQLSSDIASRPHRNRHAPRKFDELE